MSSASREFLNFRMEEYQYQKLSEEQKAGLELHKVEIEGIDYSSDELWCKLRSESVRAFKKQKDREYDLRHNFKK